MRWPFTKDEALYVAVMSYFLYDVLSHWKSYHLCYAPIQLFMAMGYGSFIISCLLFRLFAAMDLPDWGYKCGLLFFCWILTPFQIYLAIQGLVWKIENMIKTPDCVPSDRLPGFFWIWWICMVILAAMFAYSTYLRLRNWIRIRLFRRGMVGFKELIERGDYEALNRMFLDEQDINNTIGLMLEDLSRLQTQEYCKSLTEMFMASHLETCPICFEDYKIGDKVVVLPKCQHNFHPECVGNWLVKNPLCPMCRANVRTNLYDVQLQNENVPERERDPENPLPNNN